MIDFGAHVKLASLALANGTHGRASSKGKADGLLGGQWHERVQQFNRVYMGSDSIHVSSSDNYLDSMDTFFGTSQCALGFLQIAINAMA